MPMKCSKGDLMPSGLTYSRFDSVLERDGAALLRLTFLLSREKDAARELFSLQCPAHRAFRHYGADGGTGGFLRVCSQLSIHDELLSARRSVLPHPADEAAHCRDFSAPSCNLINLCYTEARRTGSRHGPDGSASVSTTSAELSRRKRETAAYGRQNREMQIRCVECREMVLCPQHFIRSR